VTVSVPHFTSFQALTYPEQRHAFCYKSLRVYTPNVEVPYTSCHWNVLESEIVFTSHLSTRFFNQHKGFYTTTCLAYLLPASEIRFLFAPIK
jgi:hypothetical protein